MEEIKEYQGTVLNVRMPTGDIEPIVSDAYTPSSQKLLEQYLIDGTADLQELLNNNGIIIENGPQWKETFGWDAAIGDELLIEVGGQTLEVKVMGIVDTNLKFRKVWQNRTIKYILAAHIMKQPKAGNLYDGSPAFCFHKNSV